MKKPIQKRNPMMQRLIGYMGSVPRFYLNQYSKGGRGRHTGPGNKVYKNTYNHPSVARRRLKIDGAEIVGL